MSPPRRVLILVGIARILDFTLRMGIIPFFPELAVRYGISYTMVGSLYAAFFIGAAVCQIPFGWAADRYRPQKLMVAGTLLLGVSGLIFAWATSLPVALAARFFMGAGMAAVTAPGTRMISDAFPREHRGKAMSIIEVVIGSSMLLSLSGFPLLVQLVPLNTILTVLSLANLPLALIFARTTAPSPPSTVVAIPFASDNERATGAPHTRQIAAILLLSYSGLMVLNAFLSWLPTYLEEQRHFTKESAALYMAVIMTIYVPSAYTAGWLSDRLRRRIPVINLSTMVLIPAFVGLALIQQPWVLVPVALLLGVGGGWTPTPVITFASEALGPDRAGFGSSLMQLAAQIGTATAGIAFGAIVDITGNFASGWLLLVVVLTLRLWLARLAVEPGRSTPGIGAPAGAPPGTSTAPPS